MSTLKRLYDYAKADAGEQLENFTTEALAGAIRTDPAPILDVLGRHGVLVPDRVTHIEPYTQVYVASRLRYGYVDLLLQVETADGPWEVWFENKVGSPEGPGQLAFYRSVIAESSPDGVRRSLAVLAPRPISAEDTHLFIPWQHVGAAAGLHGHSVLWAELGTFLKEIGMADETIFPISAREATSLEDAHRLFERTMKVLTRVNAVGRAEVTEWPDAWWREGQIPGAMLREFRDHARYTLYGGTDHPAYIVYGVEPSAGEARLVVYIAADPRKTGVRSRLLHVVEGLLPGWARPYGGWHLLAAERRAVMVETEDEAVGWFTDRLRELQRADVFRVITTLGGGPVVTAPEGRTEVDDATPDEGEGMPFA